MRTQSHFANSKMPSLGRALSLRTLALAASAAFVTQVVTAQTINVNFTGNESPPPAESGLAGPDGGMGTSWNQFNGPDSPGLLVDSTGAATAVAIDTNFGLPNTLDTPAINLTMLRGSVTDFGKSADNKTVTITGLIGGGLYDIWLVTLRNQPFQPANPNPGTEQYVGWWSTANPTTSPGDQLVDARGATVNTTTFVEGYNYLLFENVEATGAGNIVFTGVAGPLLDGSDNSSRLGLNGLQIKDAVTVVAGPVDDGMSTVEASPSTVFANGVSTSTVKVTLRDANGVSVPNKEVTLANTGGPQNANIDPSTSLTTSASGEASFSVSSSSIGIEVFTATVVADTLTLTGTASVEFTDSAAPLAFNVNFHAGANASGLGGVVGESGETWNQGTTSVSNLLDSTGTVGSTVSVSGLPNGGNTTSAALNIFDANRNFFGKGQDITISITDLAPETAYDLYLYGLSHNVSSWGDLTSTERAAGDFVTTNTVTGGSQSQNLDNAKAGTDGNTFVPGGNYVVFQSIITDGSGGLSILVDAYDGVDGNPSTQDGDCRLHISGLQIRPATGTSVDYLAWRDSRFPGLGLPDEDDDGDSLNNDFERIFGLDPTDPASSSPYRSVFGPGAVSFRYSRRTQSLINLNYKVWYSTDLVDWSEDNAAFQTTDSLIDDIEVMAVRIDPALLDEPKLFVQVRATPVDGIDPEPSLVNLWGSGDTITVLFSEPMNPSSTTNPDHYSVVQDGVGALEITGATLSSDGGSVTLVLASPLGIDTAYTVNLDGVTSGTGQALEIGSSRQFTTWDSDPAGIKVFIVAGQSNMVGFGSVENGNSGPGTLGSLRYLAVNDASYPDYNSLRSSTTPAKPPPVHSPIALT